MNIDPSLKTLISLAFDGVLALTILLLWNKPFKIPPALTLASMFQRVARLIRMMLYLALILFILLELILKLFHHSIKSLHRQVLLNMCEAHFHWPIIFSQGSWLCNWPWSFISGAHLDFQAMGNRLPPRLLRACHFDHLSYRSSSAMPSSHAPPLVDKKAGLRKILLKKRNALKQLQRKTATEEAAHHLMTLIKQHSHAHTIAGYMPIHSEISPLAVMKELYKEGKTLAVPVIKEKNAPLIWAKWSPKMEMVEGAFKAHIPRHYEAVTPDVLIVPLVGFDDNCHRLGYGGGFYDRSIEELSRGRGITTIGLAFEVQRCAEIPIEPTDQTLDYIVTERGVEKSLIVKKFS